MFARLRLVFRQILLQRLDRTLPHELIQKIMSNLFVVTSSDDLLKLEEAFRTNIISSVPPDSITFEDKNESLAAVRERVKQHKPGRSVLDLSRCGLNHLVDKWSQNSFIEILRTLPEGITWLKLRGNGFSYNNKSREVFTRLVCEIPNTIIHLDLSDNGLDAKTRKF